MRYENLIWDFDGTLFDTYPAMCRDLQRTMERRSCWRSLPCPGSVCWNIARRRRE